MRGLTGTGMQGYHGARKTLGHLEESTWNSREAEASSRTLLESGIGGQPGAPWGKEDYPALWIPGLGGQLSKARTQTRSAPLQATQRLCTHVFLFILNPRFGGSACAALKKGRGRGQESSCLEQAGAGQYGAGSSLAYPPLLPAGGRASPAATAPRSSARTLPSFAPSEPTGPGPGRSSL